MQRLLLFFLYLYFIKIVEGNVAKSLRNRLKWSFLGVPPKVIESTYTIKETNVWDNYAKVVELKTVFDQEL